LGNFHSCHEWTIHLWAACIYIHGKTILHLFKWMKHEKTDKLKKMINIHLTRLNQLEVLWSYSQSDISRPPPFWKSIYLSLEMSERNISLRVFLQMMYFLSVIGMGGYSVCVWRGVGVISLRIPSLCPRIFKIYATNI
jgi:hypothetical protein